VNKLKQDNQEVFPQMMNDANRNFKNTIHTIKGRFADNHDVKFPQYIHDANQDILDVKTNADARFHKNHTETIPQLMKEPVDLFKEAGNMFKSVFTGNVSKVKRAMDNAEDVFTAEPSTNEPDDTEEDKTPQEQVKAQVQEIAKAPAETAKQATTAVANVAKAPVATVANVAKDTGKKIKNLFKKKR
jgi:hypothetical protein